VSREDELGGPESIRVSALALTARLILSLGRRPREKTLNKTSAESANQAPAGFNPAKSVRKFTRYLEQQIGGTREKLPGAQMNRTFSANKIFFDQNTWGDAPG
jgi:hypothetical protein